MSKPANKKAIGAFVVVGLALAVVAVFVLGSGKFFQKRDKYVAYFEGSVKGLRVGAPVVFRGVKIGEVTDVKILTDEKNLKYEIPVLLEVNPDSFQSMGPETKDRKKYFQELIQSGLRAQLTLQSLVTGQLMINVDIFPGTPIRLVGGKKGDFFENIAEIPTVQTPLQKLEQTLQDIPISEIAKNINKSLKAIEGIVTSNKLTESMDYFKESTKDVRDLVRHVDQKIDPLSTEVSRTLKETRDLLRELNEKVGPLAASLKQSSDAAGRLINNVDRQVEPLAGRLDENLDATYATLKQAEKTLKIVSGALEEGAPLRLQIETAFGKLGQAAGSIQALADYIQRNPDALIRGKSTTGGF